MVQKPPAAVYLLDAPALEVFRAAVWIGGQKAGQRLAYGVDANFSLVC